VAEVDPDGTATVPGTLTAVLFEEARMLIPPLGAAPVRVIVQVLESPPARVPGAQTTEETVGAWMRIDPLTEAPLIVAARFAVTLLATGEVVAEKEVEFAPAGMFTVAGTEEDAALVHRFSKTYSY